MPITFNRPEVTSNLIFMTGKYDVQDGENLDIDVSPYMNVIDSVMTIPTSVNTLSQFVPANQAGNAPHAISSISSPSQFVINGTTVSIYHDSINQDNMSTLALVKNSGARSGNFCIIGRK
tara:strand:- start:680 stop:1039 length:360 start_codon:yes stop_codon:yes gene_type:complete